MMYNFWLLMKYIFKLLTITYFNWRKQFCERNKWPTNQVLVDAAA